MRIRGRRLIQMMMMGNWVDGISDIILYNYD